MIYLCLFSLIFIGLISTKYKIKPNVMPLFFLIFFIVIAGGNSLNPDYNNYLIAYNMNGDSSHIIEWAYIGVIKMANMLGLSYENFRLICYIIAYILFYRTLYKFKKYAVFNDSVYWMLYIVYTLFIDVIQFRNFISTIIVLFACTFLIERKAKNNIIFILLSIIAGGFQVIYLLMIPLVFIDLLIRNKKVFSFLFKLCCALSLLLAVSRPLLIKLIEICAKYFSLIDNRAELYLKISTNYGFLILWMIQAVNIYCIYRFRKISKNTIDEGIFKLNNFIFWINCYLVLLTPLYVLNGNFARPLRFLILLNNIAFLATIKSIKKYEQIKSILPVVICFLAVFLFQAYTAIGGDNFNRCVVDILNNNRFL